MKRVIVSDFGARVYASLSEAAEAIGVSCTAVTLAIRDGRTVKGTRVRWAERIFAVLDGEGEWRVCSVSSDNKRYVPLGENKRGFSVADAKSVKEITASWYFGTAFAAEADFEKK